MTKHFDCAIVIFLKMLLLSAKCRAVKLFMFIDKISGKLFPLNFSFQNFSAKIKSIERVISTEKLYIKSEKQKEKQKEKDFSLFDEERERQRACKKAAKLSEQLRKRNLQLCMHRYAALYSAIEKGKRSLSPLCGYG